MDKKLEIFEYIDNAIIKLDQLREGYSKGAAKICAYLEKVFESVDEVVGVTYRIKTAPSLKEKIIRNDLYKKHSADEVISSCSDIIGVRIECRFLEDESLVYSHLKEIFTQPNDDGFSPVGKPHLMLKLQFPQPEIMKNGHEIYRIDGYVVIDGTKYNFELQIKSLVNSFWSEIEHKVIYKNKKFMMIDAFVNELMSSINVSLKNIDNQLNMLFKRCLGDANSTQLESLSKMLVTMINELYSGLVEDKIGIAVSIKPYSESMAKYILHYSSFKESTDNGNKPYGGTIMNVIDWLKTVDFSKIAIGSEIEFAKPFAFETQLEEVIGRKFLSSINSDFFCNTFFHILFSLEVGSDAQDFMTYVRYYEKRIANGKRSEAQVRIKYEIERSEACKLLLEKEIERLAAIV